MNQTQYSLNLKLALPYIGMLAAITLAIYLILDTKSQQLAYEQLKREASEYSRSIALATETNASPNNLIRTTNAIGSYSLVEQLYIIDNAKGVILTSNHNRFNQKPTSLIKNKAITSYLNSANVGRDIVYTDKNEQYIYISPLRVISEDRKKVQELTAAFVLNPSPLTTYFSQTIAAVLWSIVLLLIGSSALSFWHSNKLLIIPIKKLSSSITTAIKDNAPAKCEHQSKDELGALSENYNQLITTFFHNQDQLIEEKEKSEIATKAKSAFLANMSHEIRTPMNGVLGVGQLLEKTHLNEAQRRYANIILSSSRSLLRIIDDILDFSRMESGNYELIQTNINLADLINETKDLFEVTNSKPIDLYVHIDNNCPKTITADPDRLRQILINLVGNALKFTEKGSVIIQVSYQQTVEPKMLNFEVIDTGIGFDEAHKERLFNPFNQIDASTTRKFGGAGLGLSISKQLVNLMGGEIGVTSTQGVGSTFFFTIPAKQDQSQQQAPNKKENNTYSALAGKNILIVDDTETNRTITACLLEQYGCQTLTASSGEEAIGLFNTNELDAILMDCLMPGMDGLETTRFIRQSNTLSSTNIPILAFTADVSDDARNACLAAGMNDYLAKPIEETDLLNKLNQWVSSSAIRANA